MGKSFAENACAHSAVCMKILFVLSREVMFFHGSGEVEAKLLQVGIQLLGHECHIAGLDSGDFFEYDAYILFSMRRDVIDVIEKIPPLRPCFVIPQVDGIIDAQDAADLARISQNLKALVVLARTVEESAGLARLFPGRQCLLVEGWFLKPFIYEEQPPTQTADEQAGYCLGMVSIDRDAGVAEMAAMCQEKGQRFHLVTDRPNEHFRRLGLIENITLKRRVPYGCLEWFIRLESCSSLFEPNPRLTCAVLEALWMGKAVFSPHAEVINKILGVDLVFECPRIMVEQNLELSQSDVRKLIYRYHANFAAAKVLMAIGISVHA